MHILSKSEPDFTAFFFWDRHFWGVWHCISHAGDYLLPGWLRRFTQSRKRAAARFAEQSQKYERPAAWGTTGLP